MRTDPQLPALRTPYPDLVKLFEELVEAGVKIRLAERGDGVALSCWVPTNQPMPDDLRARLIAARDDVILLLQCLREVHVN